MSLMVKQRSRFVRGPLSNLLGLTCVWLLVPSCVAKTHFDDPNENVDLLAAGTYTFATVTPGKCIDVSGAGTADGTNIQQWTCNGSAGQSFRVDVLADGSARLVNPNSNKCVDVAGAGTANGTNIHLWTCNGTGAQSFRIESTAGGTV